MRKSSGKYAKQKKEAVILKYLDEALIHIKQDKFDLADVCFTDLKLSPDGSYCEVYVDSRDRNKIDEFVKILNNNTGKFRTYLAKEMSTYKVPVIKFAVDAVIDNVIKIDKIFNELREKKEK